MQKSPAWPILVLGLSILIAWLAIGAKPDALLATPQKLERLWLKDLDQLAQKRKLPEAFRAIKEISYTAGDERAEVWLNKVRPRIPLAIEGKYRLEIQLLGFEEKKKLGAIVMYHLVYLETGDTVLELSRTFGLGTVEWANFINSAFTLLDL